MAMKILSTSNDVIRFSGFTEKVNLCNFQQLHQIEYKEARRCLGRDFWRSMVNAQYDDEGTVKYVAGQTYEVGDRVVWTNNVIRQAKVQTTDTPDLATAWINGPKFQGDCAEFYEEFYETFLGPYFGHTVAANRLPYIWVTVSNMGVVKYNGNDFETVSDKAYDRLLGAIHRDRNNAKSNMDDYLRETYDDGLINDEDQVIENNCLKGWVGLESSLTCGCNKKSCKSCGNGRQVSGRYNFG